ncbi:MAG: radical SAM protein [Blastocatellia bacterium]|nr:radical SAM protein [Blastocatellia bacterium]
MTHANEAQNLSTNVNHLLNGLDFLWLELTGKCNLECVHCYAESSPTLPMTERMTYADWHRTLCQGAELGCRKVQFIGGEATLHPDLLTLVSDAHSLGYTYIEVYTNATHLTPAMLETFKRCKVRLAASVYADEPEVHDSITQRKGSFFKTITGLQQAVTQGIPVRVGIIVMEANTDRVAPTKAMLNEMGITEVRADRLRGIGRGEPLLGNGSTSLNELCGACWKGQLCIDSGGRVFPCTFSKFNPIGTIEEGLSALVESQNLRLFRVAVREMVEERRLSLTCNPDSTPCEPTGAPAPMEPVPDTCNPSETPCEPTPAPSEPTEPPPDTCNPSETPCEPTGQSLQNWNGLSSRW